MIAQKLYEIQREGVGGLTKDSTNPHFKNTYISLGKLLDVVTPILNEKGVLLLQSPTELDGAPALTTAFVDTTDGDSVESTVPLMLEKDNPQGLGSAITYARRYCIMSMLGLVADEDDDGEKASPRKAKREVVNSGKDGSDTPSKALF